VVINFGPYGKFRVFTQPRSVVVVKWLFILEAIKRPGWGILAVPDHLKPDC
jgi:hypothetical protein